MTSFFFFKILFIFIERGREGKRERNSNVWLPLMCPLLGTWPATQAYVLTGNQTDNPLVCRLALSPLSHTSQDSILVLFPALKKGYQHLTVNYDASLKFYFVNDLYQVRKFSYNSSFFNLKDTTN